MSRTIRSRRIIALVAAYVAALQVLLLPLSMAATNPFATSLCAAVSDSGSHAPARHDGGCPCAAGCGMQCCAQTFVGPSQIMVARRVTVAVTMTPAPALEPVVRLADRSPQVPRAPPAV